MSARKARREAGESEQAERRVLLMLAHGLGAPGRELAILAEGNVSARLDEETFLVKASGSHLGALTDPGLVACRFEPLRALLTREDLSEPVVEEELMNCRVDPAAKKPSAEAVFHAVLLSLPGVRYVAHTHPVSVNGVLCSTRAKPFALRRLFPEQVTCCGAVSVFVKYTPPGVELARAVHEKVAAFMAENGVTPRTILLKNHGLIALGGTPEAVRAATLMTDKAARIFLGAAAVGGARFLPAEDVALLAGRADVLYRQRALKL